MVFRSSPGFEPWLENERRNVAGATAAVLHQAALALLARGDPAGAAHHASELVRLNPYDENAHALLVRCLHAAGDSAAATSDVPVDERVSGRAAVLARIEAGEAALAAGAVEVGLQRMRGAVAAARSVDDPELLARALVGLGGALVHSARGTDEEGAAALHEGTTLAEEVGRHDLAATGWRKIS
jgi:tetratricopeptide (TPR) repeat protein